MPKVMTVVSSSSVASGDVSMPLSTPVSAGKSTSTSTMPMSWTTSQPTVMRPRSVSSRRRSWRNLSSTTVLATDSAMPKSSPAPGGQPMAQPSSMPRGVATTAWAMAPGMAMARTDNRSSREKCSPTPNIRRMMPISASWLATLWSAMNPGVNGPMAMPAMR